MSRLSKLSFRLQESLLTGLEFKDLKPGDLFCLADRMQALMKVRLKNGSTTAVGLRSGAELTVQELRHVERIEPSLAEEPS